MTDHDEAIDRLREIEMQLNVSAMKPSDIHRILKELVSEAIAVREHLNGRRSRQRRRGRSAALALTIRQQDLPGC